MSTTPTNTDDRVSIAREFAQAVRALCDGAKVLLFGSSVAASTPESDIDLYVEIPDNVSDTQLKSKIRDLAWEIGLTYGFTLQVIVFRSSEVWNTPRRSSPFIAAVHQKGLPL